MSKPKRPDAIGQRCWGRASVVTEFADGINALLNYGYTVLRATVSRAICAAGLHPAVGLHHANRANAFALADDLMEPYRPIIDRAVWTIASRGVLEVTPDAKRHLAALTTLDLSTPQGMSPLNLHVARLAQQLAAIYCGDKEARLPLPRPLEPLVWSGLCRALEAAN